MCRLYELRTPEPVVLYLLKAFNLSPVAEEKGTNILIVDYEKDNSSTINNVLKNLKGLGNFPNYEKLISEFKKVLDLESGNVKIGPNNQYIAKNYYIRV